MDPGAVGGGRDVVCRGDHEAHVTVDAGHVLVSFESLYPDVPVVTESICHIDHRADLESSVDPGTPSVMGPAAPRRWIRVEPAHRVRRRRDFVSAFHPPGHRWPPLGFVLT